MKGTGPAAMSKKKNRENLAKALDESRRTEKEIIAADAQEDDELAEKIVDSLAKSPGQSQIVRESNFFGTEPSGSVVIEEDRH